MLLHSLPLPFPYYSFYTTALDNLSKANQKAPKKPWKLIDTKVSYSSTLLQTPYLSSIKLSNSSEGPLSPNPNAHHIFLMDGFVSLVYF